MTVKYLDIENRHSVKIEIDETCAVHEAEQIRKTMKDVYLQGIYHVLFDMSKCTYIDSTGLGLLVSIHKRCVEHKGKMVLYRPGDEVSRLLHMTRLDQVFSMAE